jgi:BNR repeat-like domain
LADSTQPAAIVRYGKRHHAKYQGSQLRLQPSLAALILLAPVLAANASDGFTPIKVTTEKHYSVNAYPSVGLLQDGRLLCVFSVRTKGASAKYSIAGSFSRDHGKSWSAPVILIDTPGHDDYDPGLMVIGPRVIVSSTAVPQDKSGRISTSRTLAVRSDDGCATWSDPFEIPMGRRYTSGKVNNGIVLRDGTAVFGFTWEKNLESRPELSGEGEMEEVSAVMMSFDGGRTWAAGQGVGLERRRPADRPNAINGLCEPALFECGDGSIYMLCRTGFERLYESRSRDGGRTWSRPVPSPLTGHNAPAALCAFESDRGRGALVVWNNSPEHRWPLNASASYDDGNTWSPPITIADTPGFQASYPSCIQAADGTLVIVYQQQQPKGIRQIIAVRLSPESLNASD